MVEMKQVVEEGQNVLCTVEKIEGTTVFVKIEGDGEGTIMTSEVASGRIRNLRDYVVPQKKIVCKILKIEKGNIYLSLRRVSAKEKKEILEKYEKERSSFSMIKSAVGEKAQEIADKIKSKNSLYDFLIEAKENPIILSEFFEKSEAERLIKILNEKKEKKRIVKKQFLLQCNLPDGITRIKRILTINQKDIKILYISASKFSLEVTSNDYKNANNVIKTILAEISEKAKKENCKFEAED
jgi:translation initiation factor 2 alpha subunit (eIF-2alpha)